MGAVDTTYTFTATDTITSTKMNDIIDQTTMTPSAIVGTTLEVASGQLKVRSQGITSNEMGANSVTTTSISDSSVTTIKVADANITAPKLSGAQTGSAPVFGARAFGAFAVNPSTGIITQYFTGNVSNISRSSAGIYVISLTTALPDQFFTVVASAYHAVSVTYGVSVSITPNTSSQFTMIVGGGDPLNNTYDPQYVSFAVFR